MNLNDYEAIWKRQDLPVGANADVTKLKKTFETQRRKLAATLLARDVLEASAGLVGIGFYIWYWRKVGSAGWPMALAIALILGVILFFVRERFRARRNQLGPGASLLARIEADIAELRHQRHLALNVWTWYLAPCAGAMAIHCWVIVQQAPPWSPLHSGNILFVFGAFFAIVLGFAWWINVRTARKRIEPRIAELEKLRTDLLSSTD